MRQGRGTNKARNKASCHKDSTNVWVVRVEVWTHWHVADIFRDNVVAFMRDKWTFERGEWNEIFKRFLHFKLPAKSWQTYCEFLIRRGSWKRKYARDEKMEMKRAREGSLNGVGYAWANGKPQATIKSAWHIWQSRQSSTEYVKDLLTPHYESRNFIQALIAGEFRKSFEMFLSQY